MAALPVAPEALLEAIRRFAGDPVETAKYYPEDRDFLLEFEPTVTHWDVAGRSVPGLVP